MYTQLLTQKLKLQWTENLYNKKDYEQSQAWPKDQL